MNKNLLGIIVIFSLLFSCQKEEKPFPFNRQIVNNWEFVKFCDNQNNEIYLKDFNTDTIPYFSMNLNINDFVDDTPHPSYIYFVGNGPINFFKGSYRVTQDSIGLENNLYYGVSCFKRINDEVATYDRLYIDALASASNYKVRNDSLFIDFDHSTKRMVFTRNPEIIDTSTFHMFARIGNFWSFGNWSPGKKDCKVQFLDRSGKTELQYLIEVNGRQENSNYIQDIEIDLLLNPIMKGKYPIKAEWGISLGKAEIRYGEYNRVSRDFAYYYSESGTVEITDISPSYIQGKFKVTMTDKYGNAPLFEIFDGEFILPVTYVDFLIYKSYGRLSYYDNL